MEEIPTKPYFVRAMYEWCTDNGYTPYLVVHATDEARVPRAYVRDGQITLDISALATQRLMIENDHVTFQARFGGVLEHLFVPMSCVVAIYARETRAGMAFGMAQDVAAPAAPASSADGTNAGTPVVTDTKNTKNTGSTGSVQKEQNVQNVQNVRSVPDTARQPDTQSGKAVLAPVPAPASDEPPQPPPGPPGPPRRPKLTIVK